MVEHLNKENLIFFNNFDGFFLFEGIHQRFKPLASTYCRPGTEIVSLGPMFLDDREWNRSIVGFTTDNWISTCTLKSTGSWR